MVWKHLPWKTWCGTLSWCGIVWKPKSGCFVLASDPLTTVFALPHLAYHLSQTFIARYRPTVTGMMKSKRDREEPCYICSHYHDFDAGEACSTCGHVMTHQEKQHCETVLPTCILPGFLYLGSYDTASRSEMLKAMAITHILNVSMGPQACMCCQLSIAYCMPDPHGANHAVCKAGAFCQACARCIAADCPAMC